MRGRKAPRLYCGHIARAPPSQGSARLLIMSGTSAQPGLKIVSILLAKVFAEAWASVCICYFGWMLIELMGGSEKLIKALESEGEKKWWLVPPCGCLFYPCMRRYVFSVYDLDAIKLLIAQYVIVQPIVKFVEAISVATSNTNATLENATQVIRVVSALACFNGLLVLYFALTELLSDYKITKKIILIKGMIALTTMQETLLYVFISTEVIDSEGYSKAAWANLWNCLLLAPELIPFFLLLVRYYPASELPSEAVHERSPLMAEA